MSQITETKYQVQNLDDALDMEHLCRKHNVFSKPGKCPMCFEFGSGNHELDVYKLGSAVYENRSQHKKYWSCECGKINTLLLLECSRCDKSYDPRSSEVFVDLNGEDINPEEQVLDVIRINGYLGWKCPQCEYANDVCWNHCNLCISPKPNKEFIEYVDLGEKLTPKLFDEMNDYEEETFQYPYSNNNDHN